MVNLSPPCGRANPESLVAPTIPNNLGPTLLVAAGILLLPLLVGLPLLLLGLARIRNARGEIALWPWLRSITANTDRDP